MGLRCHASPPVHAHYNRRRLAVDRHAAAQRNLFYRFLGMTPTAGRWSVLAIGGPNVARQIVDLALDALQAINEHEHGACDALQRVRCLGEATIDSLLEQREALGERVFHLLEARGEQIGLRRGEAD